MKTISQLYRHPIKAHGYESIASTMLEVEKTFPLDRAWAVVHEASKIDRETSKWEHCANFSRGAKAPKLMAIKSTYVEDTGLITLTHPEKEPITFNPDDDDNSIFLSWVQSLMPLNRAQSVFITKRQNRGKTDTDFPSISINSRTSLDEFSQVSGTDPSPLRWRGNIWVEGFKPWEEFNWVGKSLHIGDAVIKIIKPIDRCRSTVVNPETGETDIDTLKVLKKNWGHSHFGVYGIVSHAGEIKIGDKVEII